MDTALKPIKTALISVFHKDGLDEILRLLDGAGVKLLSTGGTRDFIEKQGYKCDAVEDLTTYPSIFGGRVKTLHPAVMGGILMRRDNDGDRQQAEKYDIPEIDLVIVDLYPFEQTVVSGASEEDIIEKIDIGGISLIRAAAKNFADVVIVPSKHQYGDLTDMLRRNGAASTEAERRHFATAAFGVSSGYDSAIYNYFAQPAPDKLRCAVDGRKQLRYGENPHQQGCYYGDFDRMFTQLHGKEISYNNILDIDAAVALIKEFDRPTFAVLKHNNACGVATRDSIAEAWVTALACDPVSAFGGVLISNRPIDGPLAEEIGKIFFEVIIAPGYTDEALEHLFKKKNRIVLRANDLTTPARRYRSALNGILEQEADLKAETTDDLRTVTKVAPTQEQQADMLFALRLVKHSKSNAIVLAKDGRLLASGVGQTSRVDALKQALEKARSFGFDLNGATMASDAFFPFADCVEIADKAGIVSVVHPGGSIRDNDSVEYCDAHGLTMCMTGFRHFRH